MTNEPFSRVKIDAQLRDQGREIAKAEATFRSLLSRAFSGELTAPAATAEEAAAA